MKKNVLYILFMIIPIISVAQNKEISEAKTYIKAGNNLDKAQQLMNKLLIDSVNKDNIKIWFTLSEAIVKEYEMGNENLYLKRNCDTTSLFNTAVKMFKTIEHLDSLDSRPTKNGKIKFKYRKKYSEYLHTIRPNLYNGGTYFLNKKKYKDAYSMFDSYIECADKPLFESYKYQENDSLLPYAAYWTSYCGFKLQDSLLTLKHVEIAKKLKQKYDFLLQYLSEIYKLNNDTSKYVSLLKEGFNKYPKFPFFFPRLIEYYSNKGMMDSAMITTDKALSVDSTNQIYLLAKSTILLNTYSYDKCINICKTLIAKDDTLADAYYNIGLAYYNQAIELCKINNQSKLAHVKTKKYFENSRPYMEKYRKLVPKEKDKWGPVLYNIYLNLNLGKNFEEIESLMKN
jgi:tetratricopeptide (TPR) repeat protein